jgi:hypothetical protein
MAAKAEMKTDIGWESVSLVRGFRWGREGRKTIAHVPDYFDYVFRELGVVHHFVPPCLTLFLVRQLAIYEQVCGLEEVGFLGELLDRVAPVHQKALVSIDEGYT